MRPSVAQFERKYQSTAMRWLSVYSFMANIILLCSAVFSAGCAGVCIVDVASSSVLVRRDCGTFREEPLYVMNDSFLTLKRTETNSFVLRNVGFDGKERERTVLPLFHRKYGGDDYAFSDDGKLFAYIDRVGDSSLRRLHVCSVLEPSKNLLPVGVCDELQALCGYLVMWVDSRTILLYPDVGYPARTKKEPVRLISVNDFRIRNILEVYGSYGPKEFSPSKRYILVSDSSENIVSPTLYRLYIIDLLSGQKIFEILPEGKNMAAHGAVWGSDNEIVYAVDNVVYTQELGSSKKREVMRMKPKRGIWLYAVDGKRNLHYQIFADADGYSETVGGWRIYNLDTKEDRELTGNQINGKVLMSRMRDKIVATVGY